MSRIITKTNTGIIVSDTDLNLEYLYVGDYGKENNIKADFLGYTKRIEKVEHKPVDITDKLVVTVSTQKGCPMRCNFCDCPKFGFKGNLSQWELISEITTAISLSKIHKGKRLNVHFARMGEPSFNFDVIKAAEIIGNNMVDGVFDEYLTAEAGVDAHQEYHINIIDDVFQYTDRGRGIQCDSGFHTGAVYLLNRSV